MNKQSPFKLDPNDLLYKITIEVYKNGQMSHVTYIKDEVTYQSMIGALEIQKTTMFLQQSKQNIKDWIAADDNYKANKKKHRAAK